MSLLFKIVCLLLSGSIIAQTYELRDSGLLFYLSGENEFIPDFANGDPEPTFIQDINIISDGAYGSAFQCEHTQLMAYRAPGNIYAEQGTISFYWRSREPLGEVPFPIFRVSYSDHSSWDMVWLRIDYNGSGFDGFVTNVNLARLRVSHQMSVLPDPDQWIHIALSWDETKGICFYINGDMVGKKDSSMVLYAGLDQFGPHSRIISPYQVQTWLNFMRGGDIDELLIFDRMLSEDQIKTLSRGEFLEILHPVQRNLNDDNTRKQWWRRYGWNRKVDIPPYLTGSDIKIKKVEILDAYDIKQWWWKACDGICETTWPSVYNRSRILGRTDYFIYPDWNCYSESGKSIIFTMPEEEFNHIEISGAAFGTFSLLQSDNKQYEYEHEFFNRTPGQERTFHRLSKPMKGGKIKFQNVVQETPISEFQTYFVSSGTEPDGTAKLVYYLTAKALPDNPTLADLLKYINRRYLPDERSLLLALPEGAPRTVTDPGYSDVLPIMHILIPFDFRDGNQNRKKSSFSYTWENLNGGLDGIAIDLPALNIKPTHNQFIPMNIQIKDPIWPDRNLLDFSFSVKPNEPKTFWLDTRDRILPNGYSLYMTVAGSSYELKPCLFEGVQVRLIFKSRKEARIEHEIDRFTQVKDNWAHLVEEHPNTKKLRLYDRFNRDITDLLKVNPDHIPGRYYWCNNNPEQGWPQFDQQEPLSGVPLWAFRQIENLRLVKHFVLWWINERQISNGEFGGGLSDDGDLTNQWPGPALMGIETDKITDSIDRLMDAFYENGMFTNGLSTIQTDALHSYEEGINVIPQVMLLKYGDPKTVERLLETARAYESITGINNLGYRQIRSTYFSGNKIAQEGVWAKSLTPRSNTILHAGLALVEFNGHPATRKLILEILDGLLAYRKKHDDGNYYLPHEILFPSGKDYGRALYRFASLFWAAFRWTNDSKYLLPITDRINAGDYSILSEINANVIDYLNKRNSWGQAITSLFNNEVTNNINYQIVGSKHSLEDLYVECFYRHIVWQMTGDKRFLEKLYEKQIQFASQRMYMMTEGHWWSDRVSVSSCEIQRARLGGVALWRSCIYPGHVLSWRFKEPGSAEDIAILIPNATTTNMKIIAYNLQKFPVTSVITAWDIEPGQWEIALGIDSDNDNVEDKIIQKNTIQFERTKSFEITFEPEKTYIVSLQLKSKTTPYWERPDLGIGEHDIIVRGNKINVTVHSLGSVDAPSTIVALINKDGHIIAKSDVPTVPAPNDFIPKTVTVTLSIQDSNNLKDYTICIDPEDKLNEITKMNNRITL